MNATLWIMLGLLILALPTIMIGIIIAEASIAEAFDRMMERWRGRDE